MVPKDNKAFIFYFLMSVIFCDFANQLKKLSYSFGVGENPIFSIIHTKNTGGAFSILENNANILAYFGILAIILLTVYVYKNVTFKDKLILLSSTLFCAGIFGNTLERYTQGYVIDYIKLNFINFPIFNSFDILICIAIFLYITFIFIDANIVQKGKNDKNQNIK